MNLFNSKKSIVAENLSALRPEIENHRWMCSHKRMCWKCQKEKPLKGFKFLRKGNAPLTATTPAICADCVAAKAKAKEKTNELETSSASSTERD